MSDDIRHLIREHARQILPDIIAIRRDIHSHPELSFQEKRTSEQIQSFLNASEIPFETGWAKHGIVVQIAGDEDGPEVMLRADMDALPIEELNDVAYKSTNPGVMHACGHDAHTAALLGATAILHKFKSKLKGKVNLIFQPGEEKLPGGASILIKEGLFEKHKPVWIAAQHVFPSLPAGHVGFREGLYMASADEIYITVNGKGGMPQLPICVLILFLLRPGS